jgi:hypothetical protein
MRISPLALVMLWGPATALMVMAGSALCRGEQSSGEAVHYELCTAEIFTRALRCVIMPGRTTFKVTPKEGVDRGGWEALRQFRLLLAIALLLCMGLLLRVAQDFGLDGVLPAMHGFASWFVPLLAVIELGRVLRTLVLVAKRRQLRAEYRTPLAASAVIVADTGSDDSKARMLGRMRDVTPSGVGFELSRPLSPGTRARLSLQLPSLMDEASSTCVEVEVRSCLAHAHDWRIGAEIVDCSEQNRQALLAYCHVLWPYMRLRGEEAVHLPAAAPASEEASPAPLSVAVGSTAVAATQPVA